MPLAQSQGDYNSGLQAGLKAGSDVIKALLAKDNAAYETAAQAWNSLVKTAFDSSQAGAYLLPVENTTPKAAAKENATEPLRLGVTNPQGKTTVRPSHSFDSSVTGDQGEEWQPSTMVLGNERPLAP